MARSKQDRFFQQLVQYIVDGGDRNGSFFLNACKQYGFDTKAVLKFADHVLSLHHESHAKPKKDLV